MALIVSTWIWGAKYGGHYIARLKYHVAQNMTRLHRFVVFTPLVGDEPLYDGCFVRMRMFDPDFQAQYGIKPGDRILNLDLDLVVSGSIDGLFDRFESARDPGGRQRLESVPVQWQRDAIPRRRRQF